MAREQKVDFCVGLFMLAGLAAFLFVMVKVSGIQGLGLSQQTYNVSAEFQDIGGLKVHAPVTVAGVKIGEVVKIELTPPALMAKVLMQLRRDKPIPYEDTSARILTQGLLGSNYISIIPGFESENNKHRYLTSGDLIAKTQDAIILENLIGQLLFNINKG